MCWPAAVGLRTLWSPGRATFKSYPAAHAIRTAAEELGDAPARLAAELSELEADADFVLVDAGSGLGPGVAKLAAAVDEAVIVTTPEPTSVADAHAAITRFRRMTAPPVIRILVNQATTAAEALEVIDRLVASSRQFLGTVISPLGPGAIRADAHVPLAVRGRTPFLTAYPGSAASRGVRKLARTLVRQGQPSTCGRHTGFFKILAARLSLALVATS